MAEIAAVLSFKTQYDLDRWKFTETKKGKTGREDTRSNKDVPGIAGRLM